LLILLAALPTFLLGYRRRSATLEAEPAQAARLDRVEVAT
jgi:hypothetical protein